VLNYDWQSFGRFLKIEKSHPPEARQRVSACRCSGWQAANTSFARIGQTNRSRLNQVASVDHTEARKVTVRRFGRSDRSAQRTYLPEECFDYMRHCAYTAARRLETD
jgi:hypothetical protein